MELAEINDGGLDGAPLDDDEPIVPQIVRRLRHAIVTQRLEPGQLLSEAEIARRVGVSRQPVREAFIKLAEAGLVQVRPQRGTFVMKISIQEVMNARFVREAVEAEVAGRAATVAPRAAIDGLRRMLDDQRALIGTDDWDRFLGLDEAFHRALAEAAGCAYAWRVVETIKHQMDRVRYLSFQGPSPLPLLIEQHARIVEAIETADPAAAGAAMRRHLREILNALPLLSARCPHLFEAGAEIPLSPMPLASEGPHPQAAT